MDFELPQELTNQSVDLNEFIECEIKPLAAENDVHLSTISARCPTEWD